MPAVQGVLGGHRGDLGPAGGFCVVVHGDMGGARCCAVCAFFLSDSSFVMTLCVFLLYLIRFYQIL